MSIRSVDMQVLVQKVGDVARVQQTQQVEGQHRQQEYAQNISAQNERIARSVDQPLRNESKLVHDKEEQEKNSKKRGQDKGKEKETENNETKALAEPNRGNKLDITV